MRGSFLPALLKGSGVVLNLRAMCIAPNSSGGSNCKRIQLLTMTRTFATPEGVLGVVESEVHYYRNRHFGHRRLSRPRRHVPDGTRLAALRVHRSSGGTRRHHQRT